ncbi:unnamed protein product [Rotaria magnacalcarata]|uniref:Ricin B lectin domain-containing protein n=1 Tax=Rotaria magnacalcarata TaxID=392030 RepID=A0A8S2MC11_9BILA|nr:unnamed protein product [Rotaria magnacalcarata]
MSILSLAIRVESQTCDKMNQYDPCSQNYACACFHRLDGPNATICIDEFSISCSELIPCESSANRCYEAEHICVRHPRCNQLPVCYPVPIFNQQLCPSIPSTAIASSGTYQLLSVLSNKALDVYGNDTQDGANVQIFSNNGGKSQRWIVYANEDDTVKLINENSGKALDLTNYDASINSNVEIRTQNGGKGQKWTLKPVGDGTYYVINALSDKVLDVLSSGTADETNVHTCGQNNSGAQKWRIFRCS